MLQSAWLCSSCMCLPLAGSIIPPVILRSLDELHLDKTVFEASCRMNAKWKPGEVDCQISGSNILTEAVILDIFWE